MKFIEAYKALTNEKNRPDMVPSTSYPFYIVIATHGRSNYLRETLDSLALCELPPSYCGLLLVENGAKSNIECIVESALGSLKLRYLYNQLPSKSEALNCALNTIENDEAFVFFTDDDIWFRSNILRIYADMAASHGPRHYFGGPTNAMWEVSPPQWLLPILPPSAKGWQLGQGETSYAFLGFNWGAFLSDLRAAGPFDYRFGPGSPYGATGQETNMQARMFRSGVKPIYVEGAQVVHQVPQERSAFMWAAHRKFRNGVSIGLMDSSLNIRIMMSRQTGNDNRERVSFLTVLYRKILIPLCKNPFNFVLRILAISIGRIAFSLGIIKGKVLRAFLKRKDVTLIG